VQLVKLKAKKAVINMQLTHHRTKINLFIEPSRFNIVYKKVYTLKL